MTASEQHAFLRFMQKHKAWNKFKKLVKETYPDWSLSQYFSKLKIESVLYAGFHFDKSPQGAMYWYNLDEECQKCVKRKL